MNQKILLVGATGMLGSRIAPPKGATPPPPMTPELMRRYGMDNVPGPNPLA